jgi:Zn-dependent protease
MSVGAQALENQGEIAKARQVWQSTLPLLPPDSTQSAWVQNHLRALANVPDSGDNAAKNRWARKLGPLAPIALALAKGKAFLVLFQAKFLLSLGAFLWFYWALFGAKFGIGFAIMIVIHEMGHFVDVKRRGLPADMPVFLPGLGAYVRWQALGVTEATRAKISLAGPLAGWIAAAVCAVLWWKTGNQLWAGLARAGAWLNALNLIPVWILDGGQAIKALSRAGRILMLTACLAFWLLLGESVFFLLAAGFTWKLFTKDLPEETNTAITVYFGAVLTALALVLWQMPGRGFGLT